MTYFSDRESGARPRTLDEIGEVPWGGLSALIQAKVDDGSFGEDYPQSCPDGLAPVGTNRDSFFSAMRAEIPKLPEHPLRENWHGPPTTVDILDMLEFCWHHVAGPTKRDYHDFFGHYHLSYDAWDTLVRKNEFAQAVNRIFSRNGLAYTLTETGIIKRIGSPVITKELASAEFVTGDSELDLILESARLKFLNPRVEIRREAMLELWNAWERLKTIGKGPSKKEQITSLLDNAAGSAFPKFRERLETEALELTSIGNNHQIRHTEVTQEKVENSQHIDYLFHRLFGMIQLILKTKGT